MTLLGSYMCVSEMRHTSMVRDSKVLAKEACCPIRHNVRTLKVPTCSLERGFRRPGITFRVLESFALAVRGDKGTWEGLVVEIRELLGVGRI